MADTLTTKFSDQTRRNALVLDAVQVLESEVRSKGGLSGLALKGALSVLGGVRPGFVKSAIEHLLGEFLTALEPLYQEALSQGRSPGASMREQPAAAAQALLMVADARVARSSNELVKKTYGKLRGSAEKSVVEAIPAVSGLLDRHAGS